MWIWERVAGRCELRRLERLDERTRINEPLRYVQQNWREESLWRRIRLFKHVNPEDILTDYRREKQKIQTYKDGFEKMEVEELKQIEEFYRRLERRIAHGMSSEDSLIEHAASLIMIVAAIVTVGVTAFGGMASGELLPALYAVCISSVLFWVVLVVNMWNRYRFRNQQREILILLDALDEVITSKNG